MLKMKSEMQSIDREGLVARVALEKRLTSSVRRLLDRVDQLERRFSRLQREDRKRLALEAGPAAGDGDDIDTDAGALTLALAGATVGEEKGKAAAPTRARRTLPAPQAPAPVPAPTQAAGEWWDENGAQEGQSVAGTEGGAAVRGGRRAGAGGDGRGAGRGGGTKAGGIKGASEGRPALAMEVAHRDAWDSSASEAGGGVSVTTSEEEFGDSGDEIEADMVRRLEEKMAALEGKLLGHEERQRGERGAGLGPDALDEDGVYGLGEALYA